VCFVLAQLPAVLVVYAARSLYWSVTTLAGNEWNGMDSVHDMRQVVANTFRAR
jgi:hypothetical protein